MLGMPFKIKPMRHLTVTPSIYLFVSLCGASLFEWPNFI